MATNSFCYRILLLEDDFPLRELGRNMLESQGYEVLCAGDGFEGLIALRRSPPDLIISDLCMPNMNGFEFLSVVRRRFPNLPVIVISAEFTGVNVPESVLADAFFSKGSFKPFELFEKITALIQDLPTRPRPVSSKRAAAVWVKNDKGFAVVTCAECLRTFPVLDAPDGIREAPCEFCSSVVRFELLDGALALDATPKPLGSVKANLQRLVRF